nr:hypothetical protein [uncultured Dethiosulfovibrio sp.]
MGVFKRWISSSHREKSLLQGLSFIVTVVVVLAGCSFTAMADNPSVEPLGSIWKDFMVPKHRAIISYMDDDWNIKTFRGQSADMELSLDPYYGKETITTLPSDLGLSGSSSSRVFSAAQAAGTVPQSLTIKDDFMGTKTFQSVPTGIICSSYATRADSDGDDTALWLELTGISDSTGKRARLGRVKVSDISRPFYRYKFNADGSHVYAPSLDMNVAHDMVGRDWDGDGYTDWVISYLTNPSGSKDWKNMKVALLFVDGKSLYEACLGKGTVRSWSDTSSEYTTGGDVVGGLTDVKPANSVRIAVGDMESDGTPEVALYYTKVKGPDGLAHNNTLRIASIKYDGTGDPTFTWNYDKSSDVGKWYLQYDSVTVAMGDMDGDGKDELAVLHGNTSALYQKSRLYLDIYKSSNGKMKKHVEGLQIGKTAKMAKNSAPAVEASIADLDGDGTGELVCIATDEDSSNKLIFYVIKIDDSGVSYRESWPIIDLESDWTMHPDFVRFSMDTGRYIYPETEDLRKQIGLVSTRGSDSTGGVHWGVFQWDKTSGVTLIGQGKNTDSAVMASNLVPSIVASDLDRDSMVLGEPTGFTVYDNIEPIFIVQAPPRHWDVLSSDGESRTLDAFAVLDGYSTTMNGKTSTSTSTSKTKTSSGSWGASAGFSVSKVFDHKDSVKMFDSGLEYAGNAASQNTKGSSTTTTASLKAVAQYDDQVYFRANTHDVWRYPVLAPASKAFITSGDESFRKFIQFIVPKVIQSTFASTAGKEVDWYEPWHNGLNLFSYPKKLEQTRDYPQGAASKDADDFWKNRNGILLVKSTGQIMGNVDSTEGNFTMEVTEHKEDLSSMSNTISAYAKLNKPSFGLLVAKTLSFNLNGDYSYATDSVTTSDRSDLGGITVSWPGVAHYLSPSGMTPSDQQFTVDAAIYTSDEGTLSFAYAVSRLARTYSRIWGSDSPYTVTADPALNLPRQWVINGGKWQKNPFEGDGSRIRGILFDGAELANSAGVSGQIMPINTDVSTIVRVYNYSFVRTGKVTVSFAFQPITGASEEPDLSKAKVFATGVIDGIAGRDQGISDNWQDLRLSFTTPSEQALGYMHVYLTTDGGNLHVDNDHGQMMVGIYDPGLYGSATKSYSSEAEGSGKSLSILSGSMSLSPLKSDGTLGEATSYLDPGKTGVVEATVRYDDSKGTARSGMLNVSVYLKNDEGFVSHRIVPLLINGRDHKVRMLYTAPKVKRAVPLTMIVTAPTLPPASDDNPAGRTASFTVNPEDSSSGCSVSLAPAGILLLIPLLFMKRR